MTPDPTSGARSGARSGEASDPAPRRTRLLRLGRSDAYSPATTLLAVALALSPAVVTGCGLLAGGHLPWVVLLLAPAGLLLVPRAGSHLVLAVHVTLVVGWALLVPGRVTWWALPAALALLTGHTAAALLSGSPSGVSWPRSVLRRWSRRLLAVAATTVGVAAAADVVHRGGVRGGAVVPLVALIGTAAWVWLAGGPERPVTPSPDTTP